MQNSFFKLAQSKAAFILGKRSRMLFLVTQLLAKLKSEHLSRSFWQERLFIIGRLVKAFAVGRYRQIPAKSMILIVAAIIYLINPLDLIPDAIIGIGYTDDLTILTGVYNLVQAELEKFRHWELGQPIDLR